MSQVFTLDSLREEADREFAPVKIVLRDGSEVVLRNLLRLNRSVRDQVTDQLKVIEKQDSEEKEASIDQLDRYSEAILGVLSLIADRPDQLLAELDGDFGVAIRVLNKWMGESQLGEAQSSPDSSTDTESTLSPTSEGTTE